jgi:hypothetical protein
MAKNMVRELIHGRTIQYTMESGKIIKLMV